MTDLYSALSRLVKALDPATGEVPPESECKAAFLQAKEVLEQHSNNGWQPIETAPRTKHETPIRLMLWIDGVGPSFGFVYDDLCGGYFPIAEGYHGTWKINHWMPAPQRPEAKKCPN